MTDWYYADAYNKQQGPVTGQDMRALYQQGLLNDQSLIWREGMEGWQVLSSQPDLLQLPTPPSLEVSGIDLRQDIQSINTGSAALPGGGGWSNPPAVSPADHTWIVHGGLWRRFAANCIDGVVTSLLSALFLFPLALIFGVSMGALLELDAEAGPPIVFTTLNWAITLALPAVYFAWMHSSSTQASIGKLAVGIKVCRPDGERLSFLRALGRYVAYTLFVLLTCGLGLLISGLMVAFSERKQALHDMICDSLVVDRWAFTEQPEQQKTGLDVVTVIVLVLVGLLVVGVSVLAIMTGAMIAALIN